jgi:hypothetical protein
VEQTDTRWMTVLEKRGLLQVAHILQEYGMVSVTEVSDLKQDDFSELECRGVKKSHQVSGSSKSPNSITSFEERKDSQGKDTFDLSDWWSSLKGHDTMTIEQEREQKSESFFKKFIYKSGK